MGNFTSSCENVLPEISLVDDDNLVIAMLQFNKYIDIKIFSPVQQSTVSMNYSRDKMAIDMMLNHADAYFANNKTIYIVTNFLPGRDDYAFENKVALNEKLTYLLECSSGLTLSVNNKANT